MTLSLFIRQPVHPAAVVPPLKTRCSNCNLRDICLPCGMTPADVDGLDGSGSTAARSRRARRSTMRASPSATSMRCAWAPSNPA